MGQLDRIAHDDAAVVAQHETVGAVGGHGRGERRDLGTTRQPERHRGDPPQEVGVVGGDDPDVLAESVEQ